MSPINKQVKVAVAIFLTVAAICVWRPKLSALPTRSTPPVKHAVFFAQTNEQSWLVGEASRLIAETVAFAKGEAMRPQALRLETTTSSYGRDRRFHVSGGLKNGQVAAAELEIKNYFWSPEMFAPWVEALTSAWHVDLPQTAPNVDNEFILRLTTPRAAELIQEDAFIR
jgi:hypothetical protein